MRAFWRLTVEKPGIDPALWRVSRFPLRDVVPEDIDAYRQARVAQAMSIDPTTVPTPLGYRAAGDPGDTDLVEFYVE